MLSCCAAQTDQPRGPETPRRTGRAEAGKDSRIPRFGFRGAEGLNHQVNTKFLLPILRTWRLSSSCCLWLISSEKRGATRNLGGELEVAKDTLPPIFLCKSGGRGTVFPVHGSRGRPGKTVGSLAALAERMVLRRGRPWRPSLQDPDGGGSGYPSVQVPAGPGNALLCKGCEP